MGFHWKTSDLSQNRGSIDFHHISGEGDRVGEKRDEGGMGKERPAAERGLHISETKAHGTKHLSSLVSL